MEQNGVVSYVMISSNSNGDRQFSVKGSSNIPRVSETPLPSLSPGLPITTSALLQKKNTMFSATLRHQGLVTPLFP